MAAAATAKARATHDQIWKAQGPCANGCGNGRDVVCSDCGMPLCGTCAFHSHSHTPREKYLSKVYRKAIAGFTLAEQSEAEAMMNRYSTA